MISPSVYRFLITAATPLVRAKLAQRATIGKEDAERVDERFGHAGLPRPDGALLWVNAVSVGETISIQPVVKRLLESRPDLEVLMTTGTTTSARMLADRMPPRCRHQFVPVDLPTAVDRFFDHWRPDMGVFVEAEFWPNLVLGAARRGIPLALINGRMTEKTQKRWQRMPRLIEPVLRSFELLLARSETDAARLASLGARDVRRLGDLKYASPPLGADPIAVAALRGWIGERPLWLAASTHPGEDEIVADVHRRLKATRANLLTIIAPRHPERGAEIAVMLERGGLKVARRALNEPISAATQVYIADTVGELGLFYRLADIVFVGGSLVPRGGHNMLEPARLDCAVLHGPYMRNFNDMKRDFRDRGGAIDVADGNELAIAVEDLIRNPADRRTRAAAAHALADEKAHVLDDVVDALQPLLDRTVGQARGDARS